MTEYIDREALLGELMEELEFDTPMYTDEQNKYVNVGLKIAIRDVRKRSCVDVAEVKHGHWFLLDECANAGVYCSVCHKKVYKEHYANVKPKSKFCPNCGARMDGEYVEL